MARTTLAHPGGRRVVALPSTTEGRRAFWIVLAGLALLPVAGLLSRAFDVSELGVVGLLGIVAILAGGVLALVAVVRRGERSIVVLATLPVWLFWVVFVIGELAQPH